MGLKAAPRGDSNPRRRECQLALCLSMPKRKTPRPPEEARTIARALRHRYVTPEMEAAAKRGLQGAAKAKQAALASPSEGTETGGATLLDLLREREGIRLPDHGTDPADAPFTADEKEQAKQVLALLKQSKAKPQ